MDPNFEDNQHRPTGKRYISLNSKARMCTESDDSEHVAYKTLITDIAVDLEPDDVQRLAFQHDIKEPTTALQLFQQLERRGKIGQCKIAQLSDMLSRIHRHDLINRKILPFQKQFSSSKPMTRHTSLPQGTNNPLLTVNKRANTFSSGFGSMEILNEVDPVPQQESTSEVSMRPEESNQTAPSIPAESNEAIATTQPSGCSNFPIRHQESTAGIKTDISMASSYVLPTYHNQNIASNRPERGRQSYEVSPARNTSTPCHNPGQYLGRKSVSASSSAHDILRSSNPPSHNASYDLAEPSMTSDLSSTAGEMSMYYHNAQHTRANRLSHPDADDQASVHLTTFQVGNEFESLSSPNEHQFSYDNRFDRVEGREKRAHSVIPSEYVLINENLHQVRSFRLPTEGHARRSFTPPASIPLTREPQLVEPKPVREYAATSPLSKQSISTLKPNINDLVDQPLRVPIVPSLVASYSSVSNVEYENSQPINFVQKTENRSEFEGAREVSAFSPANSLRRGPSSSTLTSSLSPPTSKAAVAVKAENNIQEASGVKIKRPGSGSSSTRRSKLLDKFKAARLKYPKGLPANSVSWSVKRDSLNKPIYKHKEDHTLECKKKLEVDVGNSSSLNPKLTLILHPYGLEEDRERNVTLEVRISSPKKAPKLNREAKVKVTLKVTDQTLVQKEFSEEKCLDLRVFYVHDFIAHKALKESRSETIEIEAQAEYFQ